MTQNRQMQALGVFKNRSIARKQDRENRRNHINLNSSDMLSTKAGVCILMSLFQDMLESFQRMFKEKAEREDIKKAEELIGLIEEARNKGKDLNKEIVNNPEFQEKLKEYDPKNYEQNLADLKEAVNNENREYRPENILDDKQDKAFSKEEKKDTLPYEKTTKETKQRAKASEEKMRTQKSRQVRSKE